ncbi:hypothetical protein E2C01_002399 [Portunus trituberculatus]|uniref:Uncharacterized protein n=1 Tax=Portunus trituberculatus TaxID=210409 RepID=A0A5B7CLU7_PORTR|nr:hypothetical protein [Portunus trituberculatus]
MVQSPEHTHELSQEVIIVTADIIAIAVTSLQGSLRVRGSVRGLAESRVSITLPGHVSLHLGSSNISGCDHKPVIRFTVQLVWVSHMTEIAEGFHHTVELSFILVIVVGHSALMQGGKAPARATIFSAGVATKQPSSVSRAAETRRSTAVRGKGAEAAPPRVDDSLPLPDDPVAPVPLTVAEKSSGAIFTQQDESGLGLMAGGPGVPQSHQKYICKTLKVDNHKVATVCTALTGLCEASNESWVTCDLSPLTQGLRCHLTPTASTAAAATTAATATTAAAATAAATTTSCSIPSLDTYNEQFVNLLIIICKQ